MSRYAILHEIEKLDPFADHQRIVFLSCCYEFPFDTTRALEFALFRTFCVPSISALLDRTAEFQERAQKRYDDTDLIINELIESGYDGERGQGALRRMNQQHGRFVIANPDFLYVLSTFVFEPIRWNERFGWRMMCANERLACFYFWREVGRRMNIQDIPTDYATFEKLSHDYEKAHYRFTEANRCVGSATRELFVSWFPKLLAPLVRKTIYALLDDSLIEAFGFDRPSPLMRELVGGALRLRGALAGLLPARHHPRLAAHQNTPSKLSERICDRTAGTAKHQFMRSTLHRSAFADWSPPQSCAS
jgi:hypothetical protein